MRRRALVLVALLGCLVLAVPLATPATPVTSEGQGAWAAQGNPADSGAPAKILQAGGVAQQAAAGQTCHPTCQTGTFCCVRNDGAGVCVGGCVLGCSAGCCLVNCRWTCCV